MTKEQTKAAAEVMMHFVGGGEVEARVKGHAAWCPASVTDCLNWNWALFEYRIKPSLREYWLCPALIGFQFAGIAAEGVAQPDERFIKVREVIE